MTKPIVSAERLRELLHYDSETGIFTRLLTVGSRAKAGDVAGSLGSQGYHVIRIDGHLYLAHRLAWLWMTGEWPAEQVDHKDCNRANNRWGNLREATPAQNQQNQRKARRDSQTGYLGIVFDKTRNKWKAGIRINGKTKHIGRFQTAEAAHAAYIEAKRQLHEFSTL